MKKLKTGFKLWLSTKNIQGVFGDGKWRLLKEIEKQGSLSGASKYLHISYRKAWGDLKKAEESLGVGLVDKHRGGHTGGRTALSREGRQWVRAYERFRRDIEETIEKSYAKHFKGLAE